MVVFDRFDLWYDEIIKRTSYEASFCCAVKFCHELTN